ncbi:hypothetical protein PUNSTDRAFT_143531 [Punctularia strigosozonata HHB-11173 SS5]|uniref:uncharacterized protein n=1 Tax=Punctularia strigosozonata (strain HHB-11173) TaxID=741275 RepID=UPI0004417A35|nr:uncharacterized protein PUNSTDRAFT_143531 [Punctularia strigosozonata HHB-11173 SS5]EIN08825.1 hypothetical protein PUNSTDRAFT_143531 [Punctularia strigosozonata HHB-11173 SS5]
MFSVAQHQQAAAAAFAAQAHNRPPPGPWTTSSSAAAAGWHAPVPFNGPPPMPSGVSISQQAWMAGHWVQNPKFPPQPMASASQFAAAAAQQNMMAAAAQQQQMAWAPWQWPGMPQAQQQSFNPYKRVPKQPDPSYWATELKENGLGLTGMDIKNESKDDQFKNAPPTPWLWAPRDLALDAGPSSSADRPQQSQSQRTRGPDPTAGGATRPSPDRNSGSSGYSSLHEDIRKRAAEYPRTSNKGEPLSRHGSNDSGYHSASASASASRHNSSSSLGAPLKHASQDSGYFSSASASASAGPSSASSSRRPSQNDPPDRERHRRTSSRLQHSSSAAPAAIYRDPPPASRPPPAPEPEPEPEPFTSKQELQPTFSPKVVRTPNHYLSGTTPRPDERRRAETAPAPIYSSPPHQSHQSQTPSRRASHEHSSRTPSRTRTMPEAEMVIPPRPADWEERHLAPAAAAAASRSHSASASRSHSRSQSASTSPARTPTSATSTTFSTLSQLTEEPSGFDNFASLLSPLLVDHSVDRDRDRDRDRERERARERKRDRTRERREVSPTPVSAHRSQASISSSAQAQGHQHHARSLGRSQTYPVVAPTGTYPEMPPLQSASSLTQQQAQAYTSSSHRHHQHQHAVAPISSSSAAAARSASTPYPRSSPHNPLPDPPKPSDIVHGSRPTVSASSQAYTYPSAISASNSTSSSSSSSSTVTVTRSTPTRRATTQRDPRGRRRGFWNRRGDHLTADMCIVYAPPDRKYPPELADYPHERDGFEDEYGMFIQWDQNRPELPDSLPRMGRLPLRPYESFVTYCP